MSETIAALLKNAPQVPRLLIEATLRPVQGTRFQPTGFPDLGAALFEGGQRLLVESAQSVANRLEATIWDEASNELFPEARGLSYLRVERKDGSYVTSTIKEAHRLNSPYVLESKDTTFKKLLAEELKPFEEGAVDCRALAKLLLKHDVNTLLHGVFIAKKDLAGGRIRIERALSGFIEADGVAVASSGGVKNDHVRPGTEEGRTSSEGFGNVPFPRDEYTAKQITAYFNLDLRQIHGYGLDADLGRLLVTLALFKITAFLDGHLRLRTACDLEVAGTPVVKRPDSFQLPSLQSLRDELPAAIARCKQHFGGTDGVERVVFA